MRRGRISFSNGFKRQVVVSIVSGTLTQAELVREYAILLVLINKWEKENKSGKFFKNIKSSDMARLELKIRDIERLV